MGLDKLIQIIVGALFIKDLGDFLEPQRISLSFSVRYGTKLLTIQVSPANSKSWLYVAFED